MDVLRTILSTAMVAALALASASGICGQEAATRRYTPPVELNVHAGALTFEDPVVDGETRPLLGGRVLYRLANGFSFGANVDWASRDDEVLTTVEGDVGRIGFDVYLYSGEVGYTFNRSGRARFFLAGGVGAATFTSEIETPTSPGIPDETSDTHLLVPLGAGLRIVNGAVEPRYGFRTEVRANLIDVGGEGRFAVGTTLNVEISAGLSVFLGS